VKIAQLLHLGADPNIQDEGGRAALHTTSELQLRPRIGIATLQTSSVVGALLEVGAHIIRHSQMLPSPWLWAASLLGTLELLPKAGVDTNVRGHRGETILHYDGLNDIRIRSISTRLLIAEGANVELQDVGGHSPLHLAASRGQLSVVMLLLEAGANKNVRNKYGNTPLHFAASSGQLSVVTLLLEAGANMNVRNKHGTTPLHSAALSGQLSMVTLLLEAGANIDFRNRFGQTPMDLAGAKDHKDIFRLFLKHRARS
jgi:ankyrin repeat protein